MTLYRASDRLSLITSLFVLSTFMLATLQAKLSQSRKFDSISYINNSNHPRYTQDELID